SGDPVEDDDPTTFVPPEPEEPTYAIGDYVWIDENGDGIQDEDEDPLPGVTVVLYDGEGNELARTETDSDGRYIFDDLPAGEYQVGFELTEEQAELYGFTTKQAGDDASVDSDANVSTGLTPVFTLGEDSPGLTQDYDRDFIATGGIDPTWDAGVVLLPEPVDPEEPGVSIIKGDGDAEDGVIENDANTEDDAVSYEDGETRDIVINVTNTGDEDLVDVVLTDETVAGDATVEGLVWTLPNGDTIEAELVDGVLTATWDGPWAPDEVITGVATLTLNAGDELHTNVASVDAVGVASGTPVGDDDPYNAVPPEPTPPTVPADPDEEEEDLARTGVAIGSALAAALALLLGGLLLRQWSNRRTNAEF
ncbi:SdrD B-like domain-containing protein, partial [Nesterenkonia muleiensis]|uniref:SdrD B-like domain-containing protein n=1 Tax=Nesterenkonia muleiensis TaxID=2282648 RepID=UPI00192E6F4F